LIFKERGEGAGKKEEEETLTTDRASLATIGRGKWKRNQ